MMRGGPTAVNMSAPAEAMAKEEVVMCDEGSGVSLYIDDVSTSECPSPMSSAGNPLVCLASDDSQGDCGTGFTKIPIPGPPYFCIESS